MEPVRLGVIGCGVMGAAHLDAASKCPLIETLAVADLREDAARERAEQFNVPKVYSDGNALIDDPDVEAVVLAMPTGARSGMGVRAFRAGKHVLTEKPVAMNADEVQQMIDAKGDLVGACCSSRYRFHRSADVATEFIGTGALGELRVVRCRSIRSATPRPEKTPPAWRLNRSLNGGGILVNWGCYDLDYLLGITGWSLRPASVLARTWPISPQLESHIAPGSDAETHFTAIICCEGGTVITFERGEYVVAQPENAWQIVGSEGTLHLRMIAEPGRKMVHDYATPDRGVVSETIWEGEEEQGAATIGPLEDFAQAIRHRRSPKTTLEQSLVIQKITDAIYASAERGQTVEIN